MYVIFNCCIILIKQKLNLKNKKVLSQFVLVINSQYRINSELIRNSELSIMLLHYSW